MRRTSRLGSLVKKLGLVAAGTIVAGLLMEGIVLLCAGEQPKFPRNVVGAPWGLRYNLPNSHYRHKSADICVWFKINGQGMRADEDFTHAKPPGRKRIVSLGDSFTIGYEVAGEQTFSSVLARELRAKGVAVEVLNTGVSGYSSAEECLYLERELLKYSPDAVLLSFVPNDYADNVRSNLFRLEGDTLVGGTADYVPLGGIGDWLNRNRFANFLSERSNAFALLKESLSLLVKQEIVTENARVAGAEAGAAAGPPPDLEYQRRLAAAILDRVYAATRKAGIPLVIQSIPGYTPVDNRLTEDFPLAYFDIRREGLRFVSMKPILERHAGEPLYFQRSHFHWTPKSHELSGQALASVFLEQGLLRE